MAVNASYVYWADGGNNTIGRANLDGTSPKQNFITGAGLPCGVALDGSHVYWANEGPDTIGRANLDGTNTKQTFIPTGVSPCGLESYVPPNPFSFGRLILHKHTGTATQIVVLPGPGKLVLSGMGVKTVRKTASGGVISSFRSSPRARRRAIFTRSASSSSGSR